MSAAENVMVQPEVYTVEIRQYTDPYETGAQIAGLRVQSVKFVVTQERTTRRMEGWYEAALTGMGAVANGTDWPAGTYLVIVKRGNSSTAYVSRLGEHREFNLETAKAADWTF